MVMVRICVIVMYVFDFFFDRLEVVEGGNNDLVGFIILFLKFNIVFGVW